MPITPPESDELATPVYGIRYPAAGSKAYKLRTRFVRLAADMETALQDFGLPPVVSAQIIAAASSSARDAHWGVPANATARRTLQDLGPLTVRTDLGTIEAYFAGLTDGGSNPGGRTTAGWYQVVPTVRSAGRRVRTTNQSISNNAYTAVTYSAAATLVGYMTSGTNGLTCPSTGLYRVSAMAEFAGAVGGTVRALRVRVNAGDTTPALQSTFAVDGPCIFADLVPLTAGDVVSIAVYQDTGSAANLTKAALSLELVG